MRGRPAQLAAASLTLLAITLAAVSARAQGTIPDPARQPFSEPLFGVQPRLVPQAGPVVPRPPAASQTHLPPVLRAPSPTPTAPAFDVRPLLRFVEEYSNNFRVTEDDTVENWRSSLGAGVLLGINQPRTAGDVFAILDVNQDSTDDFGDFSLFSSASATVKHVFDPRRSVSFYDTFTRSDDPALSNEFGLQQERRTFTRNTLGLSGDWLLDRVYTQAYYRLSTFFGTTETVSHIVGAAVGVPLGVRNIVGGGYEFSHAEISNGTSRDFTISNGTSSDSTGNLVWASAARQIDPWRLVGLSSSYSMQTLDDIRIWNVSLFYAHELAERLSVSASLGYSILSSDSAEDFSTITTDTTASYRFARAVVGVAFRQDFNQTFLDGQNFGVVVTRSYTGTFVYSLTPFIDVTLRVNYTENESTGVGNRTSDRDATVLSGGAGVAWRILPWLTTGLDYRHSRYEPGSAQEDAPDTTSSRGTAIENRVTLRAIATF